MKKSVLLFLAVINALYSFAQVENSATEIINYREKDGKIIVKAMINSVEGEFLLDLSGHNALLPEAVTKFNIDTSNETPFNGYTTYQFKKVGVSKAYSADNVSLGNNVFGTGVKFFLLQEEPYLKELGVDGILNSVLFTNTVLTIDTKRKKITTTVPYRPSYMKLDYRTNMEYGSAQSINLTMEIDGKPYIVILDTWSPEVITLNSTDYTKFAAGKTAAKEAKTSIGYGKEVPAVNQAKGTVSFVNCKLENAAIAENTTLPRSVAGLGLLAHGIVSIDYRKGKVYFQPHDLVAIDEESMKPKEIVIENGKLNAITRDYFINNIFNYKSKEKFVSKYDKPIVIDFWATWCGPCMKLMPQMEALAAKYKDKVVFMKVNADKEKELCNAFNINALPTLFFIKPGGGMKSEMGIAPEKLEGFINELLK